MIIIINLNKIITMIITINFTRILNYTFNQNLQSVSDKLIIIITQINSFLIP